MNTTKARDQVKEKRTRAVWDLFDTKFFADYWITVGSATCEHAAGSREVHARLEKLRHEHAGPKATVGFVGCAGRCNMEPVVTVVERGKPPIKYTHVTPELAEEIFNGHILGGRVLLEHSMRHVEGWGDIQSVVTVAGANGEGGELAAKLVDAVARGGLSHKVSVTRSPFGGARPGGALLHVYPDNVTYTDLNERNIERIAGSATTPSEREASMAKRTLFIDNNADFAASMGELLTANGYAVKIAEGGTTGLDRAVTNPPDLMLIDVMMEDCGTGLDLVKKLKQNPATKDVPVFVVTGIRKPEFLLQSFAPEEQFPNVKKVFEKPVESKTLIDALETVA